MIRRRGRRLRIAGVQCGVDGRRSDFETWESEGKVQVADPVTLTLTFDASHLDLFRSRGSDFVL
jgi:hypothetical protein